MNKTKKIVLAGAVPLMAFMLSGCASQKTPEPAKSMPSPSATSEPAKPASAPITQTETLDQAVSAASRQKTTLTPLPADDKAAIDAELSNIDKELKTTDSSINQSEFSDVQLGL